MKKFLLSALPWMLVIGVAFGLEEILHQLTPIVAGATVMANMTFLPKTYSGSLYEEWFTEVLLKNKTLGKNLVRFIPNIKHRMTVRSISGNVVLQPYTCDSPTPLGSINIGDALIEPTKAMVYDEWCPDDLRATWAAQTMSPGAANLESNEYNQKILTYIESLISLAAERQFWNGITAATKTAIAAGGNAALTSANEKTFAAAQTTTLLDGIVSKLILNTLTPSGTPEAVPTKLVTGTTLNASNIVAELAKVFAEIDDALFEEGQVVKIFVPNAVRRLVLLANQQDQYRDKITVVGGDSVSFLGVPLEFVPLPANVMIAGDPMDFIWGTDLLADYAETKVNQVALNADKQFYKTVFAQAAAVATASQKVLYFAV